MATGISLDRKLDILGIFLTLVGLLTIFAMLSSRNGMLTGSWISLLGKIFGWGMYLLPIGLIVIGVWLVFRHFDQLPNLGAVRISGILLLFFNLLAWMHFMSFLTRLQISPWPDRGMAVVTPAGACWLCYFPVCAGAAIGFADNVAFMTVLTTQLLHQQFVAPV